MIQITKTDKRHFLETDVRGKLYRYEISKLAFMEILEASKGIVINHPWTDEILDEVREKFPAYIHLSNRAFYAYEDEINKRKRDRINKIVIPQCYLDLQKAKEKLSQVEGEVFQMEENVKKFIREQSVIKDGADIEFGTHECIKSPIRQCVLSEDDGFDCCIFCGEPEERK